MDDNDPSSSGGISFVSLLTILFIGLKLTGHIGWSWLWVMSPIWITVAIVVVVLVAFLVVALVTE